MTIPVAPQATSSRNSTQRKWLVPVLLGLLILAPLAGFSIPPTPPTPPTSPPARHWHSFTGNGKLTAAQSRLYLFAGNDSDAQPLNDLWYYQVGSGWTKISPPTKGNRHR